MYVNVGGLASSRPPNAEIFPDELEVIVPDEVMLVIVPVVAFRVVRVNTPPVSVIEGAVMPEENVVVSGEVDELINCVLSTTPVTDVEKSTPFKVRVVNEP